MPMNRTFRPFSKTKSSPSTFTNPNFPAGAGTSSETSRTVPVAVFSSILKTSIQSESSTSPAGIVFSTQRYGKESARVSPSSIITACGCFGEIDPSTDSSAFSGCGLLHAKVPMPIGSDGLRPRQAITEQSDSPGVHQLEISFRFRRGMSTELPSVYRTVYFPSSAGVQAEV